MAIDLDGTLLRCDKQISPRSAQAIAAVLSRGVHVVLASARPPRGVRSFYESLGLASLQVNYNGALIHDAYRQQHVYHQPMTSDLARQVVQVARQVEPNVVIHVEVLDKWYTDRVDPALNVETSRHSSPDHEGPIDTCLMEPVTKLMFLSAPSNLPPVRQAIESNFNRDVAVMVSDEHVIQVVHRNVDKAEAIRYIATNLGLEAKRVMAIGDAPNDVGMIRWAGLGLAVGNAWPEVRQAADEIINSNNDDGVAEALDRYILRA